MIKAAKATLEAIKEALSLFSDAVSPGYEDFIGRLKCGAGVHDWVEATVNLLPGMYAYSGWTVLLTTKKCTRCEKHQSEYDNLEVVQNKNNDCL